MLVSNVHQTVGMHILNTLERVSHVSRLVGDTNAAANTASLLGCGRSKISRVNANSLRENSMASTALLSSYARKRIQTAFEILNTLLRIRCSYWSI